MVGLDPCFHLIERQSRFAWNRSNLFRPSFRHQPPTGGRLLPERQRNRPPSKIQFPTGSIQSPTGRTQCPTDPNRFPPGCTQFPMSSTRFSVCRTPFPTGSTRSPTRSGQSPTNRAQFPTNSTQFLATPTRFPTTATQSPTNRTRFPTNSTRSRAGLPDSRSAVAEISDRTTEAPAPGIVRQVRREVVRGKRTASPGGWGGTGRTWAAIFSAPTLSLVTSGRRDGESITGATTNLSRTTARAEAAACPTFAAPRRARRPVGAHP